MLTLEPHQIKSMNRELKSPAGEMFEGKLADFHRKYRVSNHNQVLVPQYWAETVLRGLEKMLKEFPQIKFGSVLEERNRLRMFTIPTHRPVEQMKLELCQSIDELIIETIDRYAKSDTKPFFLK